MSRSFSFHPAARLEFRETVRFYESHRRGVGREFARELREAVDHALRYPTAGSPSPAGTRQRFLKRFPYSLIYFLEEEELVILAVAHQRRRPDYWQNRVAGGP